MSLAEQFRTTKLPANYLGGVAFGSNAISLPMYSGEAVALEDGYLCTISFAQLKRLIPSEEIGIDLAPAPESGCYCLLSMKSASVLRAENRHIRIRDPETLQVMIGGRATMHQMQINPY